MKKRKIINNYDINKKVKELSELIKSRYKKEIIIIGVMNGSFFFMRDLMIEIGDNFKYDFIFCSSYYGETKSSGKVKFLYPNKVDISGKDVLILEDIVDSGATVEAIDREIKKYNPKSVEFATLLIRRSCKTKLNLFWTGYKIKNEFVIGYRLDYKDEYRNLKDIYELIL